MSKIKFNCGCELSEKDLFECNFPDCPQVWKLFEEGNTVGVFQLEKPLGQSWSKRAKPTNIEELGALIAILRPGPLESGMADNYVKVKRKQIEASYLDETLRSILSKTYASLIYQEQSIQIAKELAGFSLSDADTLRKCVPKETLFLSKQRGWISIKELLDTGYKTDEFMCLSWDGKTIWKKIKNIWYSGKHVVFKVKSRTGYEISSTRNHPFLTNFGFKARFKLNEDDYFVTPRLCEYDGIDKISSELAIILAGLITEGTTSEKQCRFTNYDKYLMSIYTKAYLAEFGVEPRLDQMIVARSLTQERDIIYKYIKPVLSDRKIIPNVMMQMTVESTRKFLSFMLACDGGVMTKMPHYEYSSKSLTLVQQIKLLLLRFGVFSIISPSFNKKYQRTYWKLKVSNRISLYNLYNELTVCWPDAKKEVLFHHLDNERIDNTNIDSIPTNIIQLLAQHYPDVLSYTSGAWYKRISRRNFQELVDKISSKPWKDIGYGNILYDKFKEQTQSTREKKVYDFQMEDEDVPYIVANGFVIHNSLGKKDTALLSKVKIQFLDGIEKTNKVSKEIGEEIFNWIEKGQRYLFNRCLSGDMVIGRPKGSKYSELLNIRELHRAVNSNILTDYGDSVSIDYKLVENTALRNPTLSSNNVKDIRFAGQRDVFKITLQSQKYIEVTDNHKFPTPYKDKTTSELKVNDLLYVADKRTQFLLTEKIVDIQYIGKKDVYDVEMEAPNHTFITDQGIVTCNSHAIEYAITAYQTAYLKTHFPLDFFCAYLNNSREKPKWQEELAKLVNNAHTMGIEISRPDLRKKNEHFEIIDKKIVFGLSLIKNVGENGLVKLLSLITDKENSLGKSVDDFTWPEILFLILININAQASRSLINSGSLDFLGKSRNRLLFDFQSLDKLSGGEIKILSERCVGYDDLIKLFNDNLKLKKDGGAIARKDRIDVWESIRDSIAEPPISVVDSATYLCNIELASLGISLTTHSLLDFKIDSVTHTCEEVNSHKPDQILLAVNVENIKPIVIKKGKAAGNEMAFVEVSDDTGRCEDIVAFPEQWSEYQYMLIKSNKVYISCEKTKKGSYAVKKVQQLTNSEHFDLQEAF